MRHLCTKWENKSLKQKARNKWNDDVSTYLSRPPLVWCASCRQRRNNRPSLPALSDLCSPFTESLAMKMVGRTPIYLVFVSISFRKRDLKCKNQDWKREWGIFNYYTYLLILLNGINTSTSMKKTVSCKEERETLFLVSHPVSIFSCKIWKWLG